MPATLKSQRGCSWHAFPAKAIGPGTGQARHLLVNTPAPHALLPHIPIGERANASSKQNWPRRLCLIQNLYRSPSGKDCSSRIWRVLVRLLNPFKSNAHFRWNGPLPLSHEGPGHLIREAQALSLTGCGLGSRGGGHNLRSGWARKRTWSLHLCASQLRTCESSQPSLSLPPHPPPPQIPTS